MGDTAASVAAEKGLLEVDNAAARAQQGGDRSSVVTRRRASDSIAG